MEIKLDSKLMKALSGLFFFAIAIIFFAAKLDKLSGDLYFFPGLFLMLSAFAVGYAAYLEKFDTKLCAFACLYFLFAIVMLAKKGVATDYFFLGLWAALEGVMLVLDGIKDQKANLWFVAPALGALVVLFGFIACFMTMGESETVTPMIGIAFLFISLAKMLPMCADYLPKCELKLKK